MKTIASTKQVVQEASKVSQEKTRSKSAKSDVPSTMTRIVTQASGKLDEELTRKAVTALLRHHTDGIDPKQSLLGTDVAVQVQFGLEVAPGKSKTKPISLSLPNPLYKLYSADPDDEDSALEEPEVCLIVKEESKAEIQEMIAQFPQYMGCIKKVLGLQSLRTKHGEFKQRRDLLARFTCFLADDRILPMLTSALGKDFLAAKKQPIPVRVTRKESLPFAIQKALSATYLHIPEGTCITVRVGFTHMTMEKLVQNVIQVCDQVGMTIPRKWANIRSVAIKLPTSTALPIYNKTPAELYEISKMAGLSSAWKSVEECDAEKQARVAEADKTKDVELSKRKSEKSPLLRALKKQKKETAAVEQGNEHVVTKVIEVKETKKVVSSTKKRKESPTVEADNESTGREVYEATKSAKKAQKLETKQGDKASPKVESKPGVKHNATKSPRLVHDKGTKEVTGGTATFIPAKRFEISKKGFVFKNGSNGLGYYIDVKPVVNKAAMDAIARMQSRPKQQKQSPRGNSKRTNSSKSGGKQRRR